MNILEQAEIKMDIASSENNLNKKGDNWLLGNTPGACLPHLGKINYYYFLRKK